MPCSPVQRARKLEVLYGPKYLEDSGKQHALFRGFWHQVIKELEDDSERNLMRTPYR